MPINKPTNHASATHEDPAADHHPANEQPLQTPWTFWFDRVSNEPYAQALQRLGTVHTVQGFWRYYCNLTRPGQLQPGDNYHLFRGALQPAQETLPGGGCWLYRMKRNRNGDNLTPSASSPAAATALEVELNRLWEKLLLSLVGESIGEPCVVGAGVSVREHERVISVWCRGDVGDDPQIFTRVGRQLDTHVFGSAGRAPTAPGQSGTIGGGWSCQPLQWRAVPTRQPSAAASACTSHSPACAAATVAMANATLVSVSASASAASEASASSFVVS